MHGGPRARRDEFEAFLLSRVEFVPLFAERGDESDARPVRNRMICRHVRVFARPKLNPLQRWDFWGVFWGVFWSKMRKPNPFCVIIGA